MKKLFLTLSVIPLLSAHAAAKPGSWLVFGADDRTDSYQVQSPVLANASKSIFTFIDKDGLALRPDGKYEFSRKRTQQEYLNLCPGEKFAAQPAPGSFCTGFLAGPDVGVSAGHCIEDDELQNFCDKYYLVFDYVMNGPGEAATVFSPEQIYTCSSVIKRFYAAGQYGAEASDFAVLRLSRAAEGRPVLKIRSEGKVADNAVIGTIGHPKGLPQKFVTAAKITDNSPTVTFNTDLDSFHGNSGGPAINMETGAVEGLLIRIGGYYQNDGDYVLDSVRQCKKSFIADPSRSAMVIVRTTSFAQYVPR